MKYILINLSPRLKGTSRMLAEYFSERLTDNHNTAAIENLYSYSDNIDELLHKIREAESVVLIGPCYINTFPAETFMLLRRMQEKENILHGQSLYGFIQGGMPYVHTHECAVKMLENYAAENNVIFKGGFVMGGGAILNGRPLENAIGAKKLLPAVETFIGRIKENIYAPEELYKEAAVKIPGFMASIIAFFMDRQIKKELKDKGIDHKVKVLY